ncbi:MAG: hypothetical protein QW523_00045 [Nitrososphaerota archaeon]
MYQQRMKKWKKMMKSGKQIKNENALRNSQQTWNTIAGSSQM